MVQVIFFFRVILRVVFRVRSTEYGCTLFSHFHIFAYLPNERMNFGSVIQAPRMDTSKFASPFSFSTIVRYDIEIFTVGSDTPHKSCSTFPHRTESAAYLGAE